MKVKFRQSMAVLVIMGLVWAGAAFSGLANIRIVEDSGGVKSESLYKGNRVATVTGDGENSIIMCSTEEVIVMSSETKRYWRGEMSVFTDTFAGISEELSGLGGDMGGMGDLGALFGGMFGGQQQPDEILVRVTKVGEETVAGYAADKYVVETGSANNWRVYEELSISIKLMDELKSEVGDCTAVMDDFMSSMGGFDMLGLEEFAAVMESPDYNALLKNGYPVRSKQFIQGFFGSPPTEISSVVVEVKHENIPEDAFAVPAGYQKVDSVFHVYDM